MFGEAAIYVTHTAHTFMIDERATWLVVRRDKNKMVHSGWRMDDVVGFNYILPIPNRKIVMLNTEL